MSKENEFREYLGVKLIKAREAIKGYNLPSDAELTKENTEVGYQVMYEDGYESWSPLNVFEKAYRRTDGLNFGLAIEAVKMGYKVARKGWNGWNGKGMYIYLTEGKNITSEFIRDEKVFEIAEQNESKSVDINAHIDMKCADGSITIGWTASQPDMLSDDWMIIKD